MRRDPRLRPVGYGTPGRFPLSAFRFPLFPLISVDLNMRGVIAIVCSQICFAAPALHAQLPLTTSGTNTSVGSAAAPADTSPQLRRGPFAITEADRAWWAFQPVVRPPLPAVRGTPTMQNPIDAFLLAQLQAKGLSFNPPASRRELIRRAYFDLIGLPPSPEAVDAFVADSSARAWERVIDHLLGLPQYGERWARHWLDLVRYAESNGYERDAAKPHAWRYRDYVIRSFNQDKPYDRFVAEQLAGDELPGPFDADAIIATGFYRLHVWDDEPDNSLAAEFDDLDDIMVATSATFLGLTVGCARCHDHKFDPISQADYYQLLAFFRSINPYGLPHTGGGGRGTGRITHPLAPETEVAAWNTRQQGKLEPLRAQLAATTNAETRQKLEAQIKNVEAEPAPFDSALAVQEDPIKPTQILHRGDVHSPGAEVQPGFLSVLSRASRSPAPSARADTSDSVPRRLALARWITRADHPLTARVMANRVWQHHFGRGLVRSPNDFGRTGEVPTHPQLLDYLASELVASGWRLKYLHKLILLSQAYQMSSRTDNPAALRADEANDLFWRQNPRRAEAEVLRDTLLAVAGSLNLAMGGPSVFPSLPKEVHSTQDSAGKGWSDSPPAEQNRRTIYLVVKRALIPPLLDTFDYSTTTVPVGSRSATTVAPQALMLLDDSFVQLQAGRFAARLLREAGVVETNQIRRAFALALQRAPTGEEMAAAREMLAIQHRLASANRGSPPTPEEVWRPFCAAMLNLNELLYID